MPRTRVVVTGLGATTPLGRDVASTWDALLAGVVEQCCFDHGVAVPAWTLHPARFLDQWWFVTPYPSLHASAFVATPAALANRGVFIHGSSLESV